MTEPRYARLKETTVIDDVTREIRYSSYTDKLSSAKVQREQDIRTDMNHLLKDVVTCLESLKETEDELVLAIKVRHGQPHLITKTWTVSKEYYGK